MVTREITYYDNLNKNPFHGIYPRNIFILYFFYFSFNKKTYYCFLICSKIIR